MSIPKIKDIDITNMSEGDGHLWIDTDQGSMILEITEPMVEKLARATQRFLDGDEVPFPEKEN